MISRRQFLRSSAASVGIAGVSALGLEESRRLGTAGRPDFGGLLIELPPDRGKSGRLWLLDRRGVRLAGPFEALGKADGQTATARKNPGRSTLLPYGDTPTGGYQITEIIKVGDGTHYAARSYGTHGALRLSPVSGDAKTANDVGGRTGLLIHGGAPGPQGRLRPTNGCIRLSNTDMKRLLDELFLLEITQALPSACEVNTVGVAVRESAADEGYDERDPPPDYPDDIVLP